jgi:hypothetical protein
VGARAKSIEEGRSYHLYVSTSTTNFSTYQSEAESRTSNSDFSIASRHKEFYTPRYLCFRQRSCVGSCKEVCETLKGSKSFEAARVEGRRGARIANASLRFASSSTSPHLTFDATDKQQRHDFNTPSHNAHANTRALNRSHIHPRHNPHASLKHSFRLLTSRHPSTFQ